MADRLLIVMVNTDLNDISEVGAPFFQAAVAASMEFDVEIVFIGRSCELARKGFAETLNLKEGSEKNLYDVIKEAHEAGVRFKICTRVKELNEEDFIPEIEEAVGSAYIISAAMADGTVTFTY